MSASILLTQLHSHTSLKKVSKKVMFLLFFSVFTESTEHLLILRLFMASGANGTYGQTCNTTSKLCDILHPCTVASTCQSGDGTATCHCPASKFDAGVDMCFLFRGYLPSLYMAPAQNKSAFFCHH